MHVRVSLKEVDSMVRCKFIVSLASELKRSESREAIRLKRGKEERASEREDG